MVKKDLPNVVIVKFINGEEIIGELKDSVGSFLVMKNVAAVIIRPPTAVNQQPGIGLVPWPSFLCDDDAMDGEIPVNMSTVQTYFVPVKQMISSYHDFVNQMNSSLLLPQKPNLILPE